MKKTKIRIEKPEVTSSVALVPVAFLAAERNFFRVFGRVPDKISSVDEEKVIH